MSGLQADARSMVEHARVECQNHAFHYAEPLRVESCTQAICDLALRFGEGADGEESVMSRPFGVALLIAGFDEDGPQLYLLPLTHHCPSWVQAGRKLSLESNANTTLSDTTPNLPAPSTATMPKQSDPVAKAPKQNSKPNTTAPSRYRKPRPLF